MHVALIEHIQKSLLIFIPLVTGMKISRTNLHMFPRMHQAPLETLILRLIRDMTENLDKTGAIFTLQ